MRKLFWCVALAWLIAGGLGVHFMLTRRGPQPPFAQPGAEEEEQEAPRAAFVPLPRSTPSVDKLLEALEIIEPIVVEGAPTDPPPPPEFGGAALPGTGVRVVALGPAQPPRPDQEPGQRQEMPYAAEASGDDWIGASFWHALTRLFGASETAPPAQLNETVEPPSAEEQSEPTPVKTPLPPVVDYHYHSQEMHCPYTGRCPIPLYPVPPPAAPQTK